MCGGMSRPGSSGCSTIENAPPVMSARILKSTPRPPSPTDAPSPASTMIFCSVATAAPSCFSCNTLVASSSMMPAWRSMQGWCHMVVARNEVRPYRKKVRAERQGEPRQRIIESAVTLHLERGPAQTSINAIAERAGVNRVTIYRHFPDARTLLEACSAHARRLNPPPDLDRWRQIDDPRRRTEVALTQLYDYFRRTEPGWANVLRDAELAPLVKEMAEERRLAYLRQARDVLLAGRHARGRRRLLGTVLGLAVDFRTWQTLARREGLEDRTAVALMVHLADCIG